MTSKKNDLRFDVAFSFTQEDEQLATEIHDLLQDRLSLFLYSRRQQELLTRDGEEEFNRVFGREARVVVVLHRKKWGNTPWTRIEETAIKNRAYDQSYGFCFVIPTERPSSVPDWFPKTRIWFGLDRWGAAGAAAAIEAKVAEAGGEPRSEKPRDRAARLNRELQAEQRRDAFRRSTEGVAAAKTELENLFQAFKREAGEVGQEGIQLQVRRVEVGGGQVLVITGSDISLSVGQEIKYQNSLDQSLMLLTLWKGVPPYVKFTISFDRASEIRRSSYEFDTDTSGAGGWRELEGKKRLLRTEEIAESGLNQILDVIRRKRLGKPLTDTDTDADT